MTACVFVPSPHEQTASDYAALFDLLERSERLRKHLHTMQSRNPKALEVVRALSTLRIALVRALLEVE